MNKLLKYSLIASPFLLSLAQPVLADVNINCPLSDARRTITDPLPAGWWTTPIVNHLTETKVQPIAGRPALMCIYGSSGSVQRNAPDNNTCTAVAGGFRCVTNVPAPVTFSTGSLDVPQTYTFDLDTGRVQPAGADLWFQAETADLLYLVPRNGALMAVGNRSNRGFAGCSAARFTPDRASLLDVPVGSYVCVKTNEGRISQFRMNAISAGSPKRLSIGYTTWR
ncbi:MAG: hypothetical protein PHE17_01940 [Thiothrix sp.]|uniref:hypothetical protein n=1 Tax=Thiothrix sp. TaxID=1032 RepID=UPI00262A52BC|nr:hypothetical protein [Thiothrix sp.]MDD5391760.1 hypothetical protein [Thiothrix sp.]